MPETDSAPSARIKAAQDRLVTALAPFPVKPRSPRSSDHPAILALSASTGPIGLSLLDTLLGDISLTVRESALEALRSVPPTDALPRLQKVALDKDHSLAIRAFTLLPEVVGDMVTDWLGTTCATAKDPRVRALAAAALRTLQPNTSRLLATAKTEQNKDVRRAILETVAATVRKPSAAVVVQLNTAWTTNPQFHDTLVKMIAHPGNEAGASLLISYFNANPKRTNALAALGTIGGPTATAFLTKYVSDHRQDKTANPSVEAAVRALGQVHSDDSTKLLLDLIDTAADSPYRQPAFFALAQRGRVMPDPHDAIRLLGLAWGDANRDYKTLDADTTIHSILSGIAQCKDPDGARPFFSYIAKSADKEGESPVRLRNTELALQICAELANATGNGQYIAPIVRLSEDRIKVSTAVRRMAIAALGQSGVIEAVRPLTKLGEHASHALSPDATSALAVLLSSKRLSGKTTSRELTRSGHNALWSDMLPHAPANGISILLHGKSKHAFEDIAATVRNYQGDRQLTNRDFQIQRTAAAALTILVNEPARRFNAARYRSEAVNALLDAADKIDLSPTGGASTFISRATTHAYLTACAETIHSGQELNQGPSMTVTEALNTAYDGVTPHKGRILPPTTLPSLTPQVTAQELSAA